MAQQDISINELVSKIKRGEIRLPEMQRQYVWQQTRVRDLLDSLYRGYPSGTILTWETGEGVATRDFAVEQDISVKSSFQLLLDGQQRLTSLSAILLGEPIHVRGRKKPIDILFNLEHPDNLKEVTEVFENETIENNSDDDEETENNTDNDLDEDTTDANEDELLKRFNQMAFVIHTNKLVSLPNWVSVTEIFKEPRDKPFLQKAGVEGWGDPRYYKYTERLKRLRLIKDYKYRVHILDREKSYEEVTEIFVRVNSLGTKLKSSDLALAQITAKWRNSLEIFQKFESQCMKKGFNFGLAIHIRNLVAFATGQSRFRTVGNLSKEFLEEKWKDSQKGMEYALNFIRNNVGIDSPALLSSPFIVIALATYGYSKNYNLSPEENALLRHWGLVANAKARYSRGSTESFLDQDLAAIHKNQNVDRLLQILETQVGRLKIQSSDLENRNSRSAYFKTMFMAFRKDNAQDWQDQLIISLNNSGAQHALQFHHIFPQALLKRANLSNEKINDISNLAFINGKTNRRISDKAPFDYLPAVIEKNGKEALIKQCIPADPSLWKIESYDKFLEKRRKLIAKKLNDFLGNDKT